MPIAFFPASDAFCKRSCANPLVSGGLAGRLPAGARALDRRGDPRARAVRAVVLEQGVEVLVLERVEQGDDLVGVEVVVVVEGGAGAVGGGLFFALARGVALGRGGGPAGARADGGGRRLGLAEGGFGFGSGGG